MKFHSKSLKTLFAFELGYLYGILKEDKRPSDIFLEFIGEKIEEMDNQLKGDKKT